MKLIKVTKKSDAETTQQDPMKQFENWCQSQEKVFGPFGRKVTVYINVHSYEKSGFAVKMDSSATGSLEEKDMLDHVKNIEDAKNYFLKISKEAESRFKAIRK